MLHHVPLHYRKVKQAHPVAGPAAVRLENLVALHDNRCHGHRVGALSGPPVCNFIRRHIRHDQLRLSILYDGHGFCVRYHAHVFHDGGQHLAGDGRPLALDIPLLCVDRHAIALCGHCIPGGFIGPLDTAHQAAFIDQHFAASFIYIM